MLCLALVLIMFFYRKVIMDEDNVQLSTNPNEQNQNGNIIDTQRRPQTFEDAVNCLTLYGYLLRIRH